SGDAEQHVEIGGVRYSHLIDPATEMGLTRRIGVTAVARRGIDADPLATAVSVLGAERGIELVETKTRAAALIVTTDEGVTRVTESRRFRRLKGR
ncbi:MAG: FAD:protein FMN transferase, partial [Bryobacteraceae bacterium]